jgi:hypothetical protein
MYNFEVDTMHIRHVQNVQVLIGQIDHGQTCLFVYFIHRCLGTENCVCSFYDDKNHA